MTLLSRVLPILVMVAVVAARFALATLDRRSIRRYVAAGGGHIVEIRERRVPLGFGRSYEVRYDDHGGRLHEAVATTGLLDFHWANDRSIES